MLLEPSVQPSVSVFLIDNDMKRKDLIQKTGLSYATIAKLENGQNVQMEVLERICKEFKCQLNDIAEIIF